MLWWDPVGVYGVPKAIDEYDGYVGQVGRLLREGASHEGLADYFSKHDFGLPPNRARDTLAAKQTLEWFSRSMARLGELDD
jgi:hypothetical protein